MGVSIWEGGKAERAAAALETISEHIGVIDDTAGSGDTDKVWSADKVTSELADKYEKPQTGIPASDLASGVIPSVPVQDVQINGSSILSSGVANVPVASDSAYGVVKTVANGGTYVQNGYLMLKTATADDAKAGSNSFKPITPNTQDESVFYGLSKVAGVDLKDETVTVGTYPSASQSAIRTMIGAGTGSYSKPSGGIPSTDLADSYIEEPSSDGTNGQVLTTDGNGGRSWTDKPSVPVTDVQINGSSILSSGVANVPIASANDFGVVKTTGGKGVTMVTGGIVATSSANSAQVKAGTQGYNPIVPFNQHESVFYGLAKAAGDATQTSSSNAVGTYTETAKAAIRSMLGVASAVELEETVSGTTPTIIGQPNVRYVCGEVSTLSITPPASGTIDVVFTSGSTATVLTIPNTVKLPAWFDAGNLEASTVYEIMITNGVYGGVMAWAD